MMTANKILAVSFIAMLAVSTANATVVTQTNIVGSNGVDVGVVAVEGVNKVQIKGPGIGYGDGAGAANATAKTTTVDGITSLEKGQVVYVKAPNTSTVANSTLNVNGLGAKAMRYNGAAITTSTDSIVWKEGCVSAFVYDGTYWNFAGKSCDTTYSKMTAAEISAGTGTTARVIAPADLKTAIETWAPETDISGKQDIAKMVTSTTEYNDDIADGTKYPNMPVVDKMISDSQVALTSRVTSLESGKIDKTVAGDANTVMVRGTGGTYVKGSGTDVSVSNTGAITVNHATAADSATSATSATKDGAGNTISSYYEAKSNVTSKGDTDTPVYFDASGVAKPITAYDGNAATATKATKDGDGNTITTTYATKSELTSSAGNKIDKTIANDKDSLMARDGSGNYVKGTSSDISVATANGTTTVTVTHATAADSATTAASATKATQDGNGNTITSTYEKLSNVKSKGNSTTPVYFDSNGVATAITSYGGTAAKATADASGNTITTTYATKSELTSAAGDKVDKTVANDKNGVIVRNSAGLAMKGTGSDITVSDAGAITVAHATAADSATTATSATKDGNGNTISSYYEAKSNVTSKGDTDTPVYFDASGVAKPITAYDGNAATATKATQDASGNVITSTYATKTENNAKQATANMVTSTTEYNDDIADGTKYPNMPVVNQMISDSQVALTSRVTSLESGKIDKTVAGDANAVMVRNASGTYVKGTGSDVSVSNGAVTVNHSIKSDFIPTSEPSGTQSGYAAIWVE